MNSPPYGYRIGGRQTKEIIRRGWDLSDPQRKAVTDTLPYVYRIGGRRTKEIIRRGRNSSDPQGE
jgi:hypothetical protein